MIEQLRIFVQSNGVVVGVIVTILAGALLWVATRLLRFARAYGLRQLRETAKDAFLAARAAPVCRVSRESTPRQTLGILGPDLNSAHDRTITRT